VSLRTTLAATAAAAILVAAAGAVTAIASNSSSADSAESTTTTSAATDRATYDAGDAGTVTVVNDGGALRFESIRPAGGWVSDIEVPSGREIEVNFTSDGRRIDFNAELEDGQIRVRVRDRAASNDDDSQADVDATPAPTPSPAATPSGNVHSVAAGSAGVVHYIFDGSLLVTSVDTASGWAAEIEEQRGNEIEVVFTSNGSRIDVEVEIEDGAPRERVRTRDDDGRDDDFRHGDDDDRGDDDRGDDDHDDDRSGPGGGGDDDDRSGHGGGDDDHDNSGRDHPEDD
jgi:hypothetical protein